MKLHRIPRRVPDDGRCFGLSRKAGFHGLARTRVLAGDVTLFLPERLPTGNQPRTRTRRCSEGASWHLRQKHQRLDCPMRRGNNKPTLSGEHCSSTRLPRASGQSAEAVSSVVNHSIPLVSRAEPQTLHGVPTAQVVRVNQERTRYGCTQFDRVADNGRSYPAPSATKGSNACGTPRRRSARRMHGSSLMRGRAGRRRKGTLRRRQSSGCLRRNVGFIPKVFDTLEGVFGFSSWSPSREGIIQALRLRGEADRAAQEACSGVPRGDQEDVRRRRNSVKASPGRKGIAGSSHPQRAKHALVSAVRHVQARPKLSAANSANDPLFPDHANGWGCQ